MSQHDGSMVVIPWRRPAIWVPFLDAVYAARDFFLYGVDEVPTSRASQDSQAKEPMKMIVARAPATKPLPKAEATSSSARLEAAVRKAAVAKTKARNAKTALKKAKMSFRLARKAAKAARKEVDALQEAITRAEEKAAAAARKSRATRRAPQTDLSRVAANTTPRPPGTPKPVRKTRRASSSIRPDADVVYSEALATPTDTLDGSPSATAS